MPDNKTFKFAVLVSILIHSVILFSLPHMPFVPSKRSLEKIKIVYYKMQEKPESKDKLISRKDEPRVEKLPEVKKEDMLNPPKPFSEEKKKEPANVKQVKAVEKAKEKRFEAIVNEEKDEYRKASYISYYRAVREKIKQLADAHYSRNKNLREGEVFLSFIVASSGELLQLSVVEEKSIDDNRLRDIALRSIQDASPFPRFPEGMNQYQIAFNVIIAFELNK